MTSDPIKGAYQGGADATRDRVLRLLRERLGCQVTETPRGLCLHFSHGGTVRSMNVPADWTELGPAPLALLVFLADAAEAPDPREREKEEALRADLNAGRNLLDMFKGDQS